MQTEEVLHGATHCSRTDAEFGLGMATAAKQVRAQGERSVQKLSRKMKTSQQICRLAAVDRNISLTALMTEKRTTVAANMHAFST